MPLKFSKKESRIIYLAYMIHGRCKDTHSDNESLKIGILLFESNKNGRDSCEIANNWYKSHEYCLNYGEMCITSHYDCYKY